MLKIDNILTPLVDWRKKLGNILNKDKNRFFLFFIFPLTNQTNLPNKNKKEIMEILKEAEKEIKKKKHQNSIWMIAQKICLPPRSITIN